MYLKEGVYSYGNPIDGGDSIAVVSLIRVPAVARVASNDGTVRSMLTSQCSQGNRDTSVETGCCDKYTRARSTCNSKFVININEICYS